MISFVIAHPFVAVGKKGDIISIWWGVGVGEEVIESSVQRAQALEWGRWGRWLAPPFSVICSKFHFPHLYNEDVQKAVRRLKELMLTEEMRSTSAWLLLWLCVGVIFHTGPGHSWVEPRAHYPSLNAAWTSSLGLFLYILKSFWLLIYFECAYYRHWLCVFSWPRAMPIMSKYQIYHVSQGKVNVSESTWPTRDITQNLSDGVWAAFLRKWKQQAFIELYVLSIVWSREYKRNTYFVSYRIDRLLGGTDVTETWHDERTITNMLWFSHVS